MQDQFDLIVWVFCLFEGSRSFYSSSYVSRDEKRLLSGGTVYATKDETWQGPTWRACWYVRTNARYESLKLPCQMLSFYDRLCSTQILLFTSIFCLGSGIGTGPGVIQDRFSPTMGRHRSNQLFNGHGGHLMPPAQSQFGDLGKSFLKSQVRNVLPKSNFVLFPDRQAIFHMEDSPFWSLTRLKNKTSWRKEVHISMALGRNCSVVSWGFVCALLLKKKRKVLILGIEATFFFLLSPSWQTGSSSGSLMLLPYVVQCPIIYTSLSVSPFSELGAKPALP